MSDEMERYTMRTAAVQDGIYMRAKCLVHADCRAHGRMCFPSGRRVKLDRVKLYTFYWYDFLKIRAIFLCSALWRVYSPR